MYPTREEAERLLLDAEKGNPGQWVAHSRYTAHCAEKIAQYCGMDVDKAYVLGLLHDVGRKFGVFQLRHVSEGYKYMLSQGYDDVARICLTHSFNQDKIEAYVGKFDAPEEDIEMIRVKLKETVQDDYDKLIQLCDALAGAEGIMDIIDRMSDVKRRYGSYDPEKWQTNLDLKDYFEKKMGMDIYLAVDKEKYLYEFLEKSKEILKEKLTGIYLHGSAVMGCFNPAKSDLDIIVVVNEKMDNASKRAFMDLVVDTDSKGPAKGIEMSIVTKDVCKPFVYPTPFELHFSEMHLGWYRDNPEDYVQKMNGTDKDLAAHFTILGKRGKCLWGQPIEEVFGEVPSEDYMDSIWEDIVDAPEDIADNTMYLTLNLARVLAYCKEKLVLSKKEGGEWGLRNLPEKYHGLISKALLEYEKAEDVPYDTNLAKEYAQYMIEQISDK